MTRVIRSKVLRSVAVTSVVALGLASAPLLASAGGISVSPATAVVRALLNKAIVPANAMLVHPAKAVVCQCAGTGADPQYLVTVHRYFVVPGSPASVEEFLVTHVPKGGVEGGELDSGAILSNTTAFPANGPHIYLRQLAYTMTSRNASSSWLRIDGQIMWVPSRSSSQVVTGAASATVIGYKSVALDGSSGPTKVHVSGSKLTALLRALNSLPLGPQNGCMEDPTGFNLKIALKDGVTIQVYNGSCGGPTDVVSTQAGNIIRTRYSLSDTSCALVKTVVSLFGSAPVSGTRDVLDNCESWIKHPVD
jgi:hypothetical protein